MIVSLFNDLMSFSFIDMLSLFLLYYGNIDGFTRTNQNILTNQIFFNQTNLGFTALYLIIAILTNMFSNFLITFYMSAFVLYIFIEI